MHFCIRNNVKKIKLTSNKKEKKGGGGGVVKNSEIYEQIIDI